MIQILKTHGTMFEVSQVIAAVWAAVLMAHTPFNASFWCRSGVTLELILTLTFDQSCTSLPRPVTARDSRTLNDVAGVQEAVTSLRL